MAEIGYITQEKLDLVARGYIPLDKSWMIRMGVLDLINKKDDIHHFLREYNRELSEDLQALHRAADAWDKDKIIPVGESGTLYRFLQFALWKYNLKQEIVPSGTLIERSKKFCKNPEIVNWPLEKLLELDGRTTQWASAAIIMGNTEKIETKEEKILLSYEAPLHWTGRRSKDKAWEPRYDKTLERQAMTYLKLLAGKKPRFEPRQAEDYCFARVFGYMTREDAIKRGWIKLRKHETNRLDSMEEAIQLYNENKFIDIPDHRVIQAIVMYGEVKGKLAKVISDMAVKKSWPEFYKFISDSPRLIKEL